MAFVGSLPWPYQLFPRSVASSPLTWLPYFFFFFFFLSSFTLISPQFALSISGLCLCAALWDQIRFTSGLNVCSHGLLHLKGNSFSWNFAVQFETRLMLANFTPPFFQNVSSIAHTNCWRTKGICHFVMVMSELLRRNNAKKEKEVYTTTTAKPPDACISMLNNWENSANIKPTIMVIVEWNGGLCLTVSSFLPHSKNAYLGRLEILR